MHPQLNSQHQHQGCAELMDLLKDCHSSNPFMRYLGTCNDAKLTLNKCFRAERIERGQINLAEARAKRSELEKKWKDIELEA
ncbi:hypothetical protein RQP46_008006 [Phenoliferia psychrophenolica]